MTTMYDLMQLIAGVPANDYQTDILYFVSVMASFVIILYFMFIMKVIAGWIRPHQ